MVEWSDAAIEAAMSAFDDEEERKQYPSTKECLRSALDAAVKAQGIRWTNKDVDDVAELAEKNGWNDAIEAAALEAEKMVGGFSAAAAIRKLAKE